MWLTRPTVLPSESVTNAIHSSVPAGPSASSSWLEDHVRLGLDDHAALDAALDGATYVVHAQVDEGRRSPPVEEQPRAADLEEEQAGWVEVAGRLGLQQPGVELARPVEVDRPLRHLEDVHRPHSSGADQA